MISLENLVSQNNPLSSLLFMLDIFLAWPTSSSDNPFQKSLHEGIFREYILYNTLIFSSLFWNISMVDSLVFVIDFSVNTYHFEYNPIEIMRKDFQVW